MSNPNVSSQQKKLIPKISMKFNFTKNKTKLLLQSQKTSKQEEAKAHVEELKNKNNNNNKKMKIKIRKLRKPHNVFEKFISRERRKLKNEKKLKLK